MTDKHTLVEQITTADLAMNRERMMLADLSWYWDEGMPATANYLELAFAMHDMLPDLANRITALEAEKAELVGVLRNMADVVAVYALQPPHPTRQRPQWSQDQWDQLSQVCSEMLTATLTKARQSEGEGK